MGEGVVEISAPRRRIEKWKMLAKARQKLLRKYFGNVFAKVNIEFTRGLQGSNLGNPHFFKNVQ